MPSLSLVNVPVASRGIHNHCIDCQNWAQRSVHNVWWWGWRWCFPHSRTFRSLPASPFLQFFFIHTENQESNLAQDFLFFSFLFWGGGVKTGFSCVSLAILELALWPGWPWTQDILTHVCLHSPVSDFYKQPSVYGAWQLCHLLSVSPKP